MLQEIHTYKKQKDGKMKLIEKSWQEVPDPVLSPLDKLVTILCEKGVISITEAESIERDLD